MKHSISWLLIVIAVFSVLFGVAVMLLAGYGTTVLITGHSVAPTAINQADPNHIPNIFEIQQMLQDKGFDLGPKGIDGRLGDLNSYTQKAWDKNSCDQYYRKTIARMEKVK